MQRTPKIATHPPIHLQIPIQFSRLSDIAYNLWWTWSRDAKQLFARMSPWAWQRYRNPIELLLELDDECWHVLQNDPEFVQHYKAVVELFDSYVMPTEPTWFDKKSNGLENGPIAYFSTEFGWHECLQSYSGGLGVLSGDHSKSASDLGLPFVGVGLMYRRGYFHQSIDSDGNQQHFYPNYDLARLPVRPVMDSDGNELRVAVELPGRELSLRVWLAQIGRVPVLLLDSNVTPNRTGDRSITSILYISGREMRLCQEIVLGIGGARALDALGISPSVWHMNEGHSALLSLERLANRCASTGASIPAAVEQIAESAVFTTHTPVPAGNEVFDAQLVRQALSSWAEKRSFDLDACIELGRTDGDTAFNMTALAIRTSRQINGVSKLHGEVSSEMWRHLVADKDGGCVRHVTNGVHLPSWMGPEITDVICQQLPAGAQIEGDAFADAVRAIPAQTLWNAHHQQKERLLTEMRDRVREQLARHGRSPSELEGLDQLFDGRYLLVGFARRFATYKRANLLLREFDRIKAIANHADRPVQFLFAGKAHPADRPGQDLIREIWRASLDGDLKGRLLFLENYDIGLGRMLVQGVDVWLNTPKRPMEASGTSGMKSAMNGGLNCSILDGWWCEGYDASHGWALGSETFDDDEQQAAHDATSLYETLSNEIAACFYDRDENGIPQAWVERMRLAIASLSPEFSTHRMVRDYTEQLYLPAAQETVAG